MTEVVREALARVFSKLDPVAFGLSVGMMSGIVLFLATVLLVLKGEDVVGPRLQLLNNFFPGYTVTMLGSMVGLVYGFLFGFIVGWEALSYGT